jgi:serine/threonine protein kinase
VDIPERIDRYEIRDILGKGAMGSVFRAWDPKLHREVALKLVSRELSKESKARERFHREARAIAALRHPNVVEIYDYSGEDSEYLYLVMEKLDGDDVFNIINSKGVTPEPAAAAIGHELCLALQTAHDHGVIHRDMKPENVFMNATGRVVLTDFGVVKAVREDSAVDGWSQKTDVIGTPGFMAPELMMNRSLGPRTDIFALGALLYNISTGELPFDGTSPVEMFRAAVAGKYVDPRKYNRLLSDEFCDVLDGCLQAKPKRRFRSADQLREALKGVLEFNGVSDLRDDLRDYMRDPVGYARMTRRRMTSYLLQRLKVSVKDKDEALANRIRERLLAIDPDNDEVHAISGFYLSDTGRISVRPSTSGTPTISRSSARWLYLAAGILAGVALILAVYLWIEPPEAPPEASTRRRPPAARRKAASAAKREQKAPAPVLAPARVEILVKGGKGTLFVDNKRQPGRINNKRTLKLKPGQHLLEVRGRRRARVSIRVEAGDNITVVADVRKGKATVR